MVGQEVSEGAVLDAARVKAALFRAGTAQYRLAAQMGVSEAVMSRWITRDRRVPQDAVIAIAAALGVSVADIVESADD